MTIDEYAAKYGHENDNNFAAACYNDNSIGELVDALAERDADPGDCHAWGISPDEWRDAIGAALTDKLAAVVGRVGELD